LIFYWSNIDSLSCLENSVVLNHISELHTLLRKLSHTHTHAFHELSNLLKVSICRKICAYWILNYQLYLCIFLNFYLIVVSVNYTCVFLAIFRENYFSINFPPVLDFQCEASGQTCSSIQMRVVLPNADMAVAVWTVKWYIQMGTLQV